MTEDAYISTVGLIRQKDPEHKYVSRMWLEKLDEGYSLMNCRYLEAQLAKIPDDVMFPPEKQVEIITTKRSNDPITKDMYMERTTLYGVRAKLSNRFHLCLTDQERSDVSAEIQDVQKAIVRTSQKIDTYLNTGQLSEWENSRYPIPVSDMMKLSKIHSLRAQISSKKRYIRQWKKKKGPEAEEKVRKGENKLNELQTHLKYVEKAIQS